MLCTFLFMSLCICICICYKYSIRMLPTLHFWKGGEGESWDKNQKQTEGKESLCFLCIIFKCIIKPCLCRTMVIHTFKITIESQLVKRKWPYIGYNTLGIALLFQICFAAPVHDKCIILHVMIMAYNSEINSHVWNILTNLQTQNEPINPHAHIIWGNDSAPNLHFQYN